MKMDTLVQRIKTKQVELRQEGKLKQRSKRWKVSQGPIHCDDGKIPAVEIDLGTSVGKEMNENMMSRIRRLSAGYQCRVGSCCWREWTWTKLRQHMRSCHGVDTAVGFRRVHGLSRCDFVVETRRSLPDLFQRWYITNKTWGVVPPRTRSLEVSHTHTKKSETRDVVPLDEPDSPSEDNNDVKTISKVLYNEARSGLATGVT